MEEFMGIGIGPGIGKPSIQSTVTEMTGLTLFLSKLKHWFIRFRYKHIPYLVYQFQELDVSISIRVTSKEQFATLSKVEAGLYELGFSFDTGYGFGGRDWEWDWSLKGPVTIKFVGVRKEPRVLYGVANSQTVAIEKDLIINNLLKPAKVEKGN